MPSSELTPEQLEQARRQIAAQVEPHLDVVAQLVDKYAPTSWGKTSEDLVCPSGQVCLVRQVDIVDLLKEGILNQVDFLTSIVANEHIPAGSVPPQQKPEGLDDKAIKVLMDNPEKMTDFGVVIDKVVVYTILKPKLHLPPRDADGKIDDSKKVEGLVYTDSVNLTDKTFIFNHAFGNSDALKSVREESIEPVGDVESSEVVPEPPL